MSKQQDTFLQPVISVLGLAVSIIATILPLFGQPSISELFIIPTISRPLAFIAFILGVVVVWLIIQFHPYPSVNLLAETDKDGKFLNYKISLEPKHILWIMVIIDTIIGFTFLAISESYKTIDPKELLWIGLTQSALYLIFFIVLISIFATLVNMTKQKYEYDYARDNFAQTVFETLVKTRHVQPGIQIFQNQQLNPQEAISLGVTNYFMARKMTVKTISQQETKLKFIISSDGKEIIKFTHTPQDVENE